MSILKTQYETEADIPAGYTDLFTEHLGRWSLTGVEGLKTQKDFDAHTEATRKERKFRAEAEAKLKKFEKLGDKDVDALVAAAAEAEELRARVDELEADGVGGKGAPAVEQLRAEIKTLKVEKTKAERDARASVAALAAARQEAEEHKSTATNLDGKIRRGTIESELRRVAAESKVVATAHEDVLMHAGVFELNDEGKVVTRDGVGVAPGLDPSSWLSEQRAKRSHWWEPSVGGGARGGSGGVAGGDNPFDKKSSNAFKAMQLNKTDPTKAAALARAAGFGSVKDALAAMARSGA